MCVYIGIFIGSDRYRDFGRRVPLLWTGYWFIYIIYIYLSGFGVVLVLELLYRDCDPVFFLFFLQSFLVYRIYIRIFLYTSNT